MDNAYIVYLTEEPQYEYVNRNAEYCNSVRKEDGTYITWHNSSLTLNEDGYEYYGEEVFFNKNGRPFIVLTDLSWLYRRQTNIVVHMDGEEYPIERLPGFTVEEVLDMATSGLIVKIDPNTYKIEAYPCQRNEEDAD